jgi:hypothetical protein
LKPAICLVWSQQSVQFQAGKVCGSPMIDYRPRVVDGELADLMQAVDASAARVYGELAGDDAGSFDV